MAVALLPRWRPTTVRRRSSGVHSRAGSALQSIEGVFRGLVGGANAGMGVPCKVHSARRSGWSPARWRLSKALASSQWTMRTEWRRGTVLHERGRPAALSARKPLAPIAGLSAAR